MEPRIVNHLQNKRIEFDRDTLENILGVNNEGLRVYEVKSIPTIGDFMYDKPSVMPSPLALEGLGFLILLVYGLISSTPDYGRVSSTSRLATVWFLHPVAPADAVSLVCLNAPIVSGWPIWRFCVLYLCTAVDVALDMSGVLLAEDFFVYCGLFVAALCSLSLPSFTWTAGIPLWLYAGCLLHLFKLQLGGLLHFLSWHRIVLVYALPCLFRCYAVNSLPRLAGLAGGVVRIRPAVFSMYSADFQFLFMGSLFPFCIYVLPTWGLSMFMYLCSCFGQC
ncbi:hypothetical protein NC652_003709 [Populus alba x Populus x berolinensis]|nr:hypothetical protein NC652_003707 [Populus alba x Populus x berolinensis]KAJ6965913.1 hypothetical protein NC652_003709 [Populus alba x Populus x berolinensis]